MKHVIPEMSAEHAELLELGAVLGRNESLGMMAGLCSAAQAAALRRLREERKYRQVAPNWREFCTLYLRISQTQADQIIQLWDKFGKGYFEVAQLTRISADTYRAIAPAIHEGKLHCDGEAIELSLENSERVSAAVAKLRRSLPARKPAPAPPLPVHQRLAKLDQRCAAILAEFEEISRLERAGENWLLFTKILLRWSAGLRRIEKENGLLG